MVPKNTFTVLNASAGSGKTYSLVKQYITTLLKSASPYKFRQLLAITFTNKAVAEMKSRILETLETLSHYKEDSLQPPMLDDLMEETGLKAQEIALKSGDILKRILHNYAAFDVVTIDTLTHRIIRTFAKDLNISGSFDVSLDQGMLSAQAVDALIASVGIDADITRVLVDFALEKADDDKSWDITRDLQEIARLLHNENDLKALELLKNKTLAHFNALSKHLSAQITFLAQEQQQLAKQLLDFIDAIGLDQQSFASGYFYKFIAQVAEGKQGLPYSGSGYKDNIESYAFYAKSQKEDIKAIIDAHRLEFVTTFLKLKELATQQKMFEVFRSRLIPLSVLHLIKKELDLIKQDENVLLISDFNSLIAKSLRDQPAAFLYERLGERYTNYFIDEFQDTSVMQWHNLIPLVENALSSEAEDSVANSLLLVGDPKQAIYRWRGGEAEQFIYLSKEDSPFTVTTQVDQLGRNYRSRAEVITFNNYFFTHLAQHFDQPSYASIYKTDNNQEINSVEGGYVSIDFVEYKLKEESHPLYADRIIEIITEVTSQGYKHSDICILTRYNSHGTEIAQRLEEQGIQIISSESLLVANSAEVQFLHACLSMLYAPEQKEKRLPVMYYLAEYLDIVDTHAFYDSIVSGSIDEVLTILDFYNFYIDSNYLASLALYESVEYLIRAFHLEPKSDAYVLAYLDLVYSYSHKNSDGLLGFIDFWEEKKGKASIIASQKTDAVQLMSIHKSKGLEFPVVIYPYAESDIYRTKGEHQWYPLNGQEMQDFDVLMVPHNGTLAEFGETGEQLFTSRRNEQQFDAINVLYVALTRPVDRLYVVSRFRESIKKINSYSELFIDYLQSLHLWNESQRSYTFGTLKPKEERITVDHSQTLGLTMISTAKEDLGIKVITQASFLWNDEIQDAISYGNLIHELMSKISNRSDLQTTLDEAIWEGVITQESSKTLFQILSQIINHEKLSNCFNAENKVYNERPILSRDGTYHIPDRVEILPDGQSVLIDYKTGQKSESHKQQIKGYASLLEEMGYTIKNKFLIYVDKGIEIIAV